MFYRAFVCLSVCQLDILRKTTVRIFIKSLQEIILIGQERMIKFGSHSHL